MVVADRAEAMQMSTHIKDALEIKIDKLADTIESRRVVNERDIKDILKSQFEIMAMIRK